MATRNSIECPVCREPPAPNQQLEEHLYTTHTKRKLAKFIVAETTVQTNEDVSE
ncbi:MULTISPECIES: hypothetical protein [Natrinema]|uniref:Uncharacterized protein n=1 Tax=Natrinema gari JCM 14663 TaxID=1230459 RepID=L9Z752_9EURY|nr:MULTISPECIES: hypothetical protein [Natrinema]AFO56853.1 hypothetical protein NJ7G_1609 [Natrinema sp. J7-2]ELY82335.1 hypothetical protein C486_05110 [Natrinema gari JCM 14663]